MYHVDDNFEDDPGAVDVNAYRSDAQSHAYIEELDNIESADAEKLLSVGVDTHAVCRSGTFIQKDRSVIHASCCQPGVEIMGISQAAAKYDWVQEYMWRGVDPQTDQFTQRTLSRPHEGYFIRALAGAKIDDPVQSCLYIATEGFSQHVHNIVIAEEGSELHMKTGC